MRRELVVQQETINRLKWKIDQQDADKAVKKARMDVVKEVREKRKKSGKEMKKTGDDRVVASGTPPWYSICKPGSTKHVLQLERKESHETTQDRNSSQLPAWNGISS